METIGNGPVKILVVPPYFERTVENLFCSMDKKFKHKLTVFSLGTYSLPRRGNGMVNYESLLQKCRDVIVKEHINVLYANERRSDIMLAILHEEFPYLRGPSVESMFLCYHKLYTTLHVDSEKSDKVPYIIVNLEQDIYDLSSKILEDFGYPGIIRPCIGGGSSIFVYRNREGLIKGLHQSKTNIAEILDEDKWLIANFVDLEKYPMVDKPLVLIHKYLDELLVKDEKYWINVGVEGCVNDKKFIRWGIVDTVRVPYKDKSSSDNFSGWEMPTSLSPTQQELLWTRFQRDIQNLIELGFDNSMIHAEYMVFDNGDIHLVTVNGRLDAEVTELYRRVMNSAGCHGDNRIAALTIATEGKLTLKTTITPNGYALSHILFCPFHGKVKDLVNFEKAKLCYDFLVLNYTEDQVIRIPKEENLAVIGFITIRGENFQECVGKIQAIRKEILLLPELVPIAY